MEKNRLILALCLMPVSFTKILLITLQTNFIKILLAVILSLFCLHTAIGQEIPKNDAISIPAMEGISPEKPLKEVIKVDSELNLGTKKPDSVLRDTTIVYKNEALTDIVKYSAKDYSKFDKRTEKLHLFNKAVIEYTDINITAGQIIIDNKLKTVFAKGILDTANVYSQPPVFTQGTNIVEPDSILYNFETEKALIYGSRTKQGEFNVINEVSKRVNDSVVFMRNVKITTSTNLEDPEYYFYARKVKFIPGKKIVTGLINMYIADVPTPIGVPFSYFPMEKETSVSGFIVPSPGETRERGYFLQNGGYYFAVSDFFDLTLQGDYYTNGSYGLRSSSTYKKRYRFNGNVNLRYERLITSERGLPDFSEAKNYSIQWTHNQDSKASPNSRFSASVNLASQNYYRQSVNSNNIGSRLTNNFNSSISYSKTFQTVPQVSLGLTASSSQNSQSGTINLTLPNLSLNVDRIYPFAPKFGSKEGMLQNLNLNYSGTGSNRIVTTDDDFLTGRMFKDAEMGFRHSIPISTNLKAFKYFNINMGTSFQESWVFETVEKHYDEIEREVVIDTIKGFDAYRTYNFNASVGTTIYGNLNLGEDKKIQALRHVITPSVSFNYNPAFDQYYDTYLAPELDDPSGSLTNEVEYSRFDGGFYGAPSNFRSSGISFSIKNTLEAKVRDRDSTKVEAKKVTLLSNLNVSSSYNFLQDSLKLSPLNVSGSIPFMDKKLNVNFQMTLDPYALNSNNKRINKLNIANGGSLFRMTSASANFGYSFSSQTFNKKTENANRDENQTFRNGGRPDNLFGKDIDDINGEFYEEDGAEPEETNVELYNYTLPWNLRVDYRVSYGNSARQNQISTHTLNFSGDLELGPKWFVGASSGVDLTNFEFTTTQLRFRRDLESFNMTFSWSPFGTYASWNFFIGIKSSALSDLKYEKRRTPDQRL